ncbi:MAG: FlgD immunoglobulin-like domain containing protein [Desulfobacterales bacterium]|jgi:flagellar hook-associated protein 3 FlgL
MRVTNSMMSNTITRYLMQQSERLYKVQEQIATQKKINRPSDDPAGMRAILDYRNKIATVDQYLDNIERGTTRLEFTEITLDVVDDLIGVTRGISQQEAGGTNQSRALAAEQVKDLYNQMVELANSKNGKNYMFSGHQTDTPAFGHVVEIRAGVPGDLEFGLAADATNVTIEVRDESGAVINTITPAGGGADGVNSVSWSGAIPPDGLYKFAVTASNAGGGVVDYATYNGDNGTVRIIMGENTELTLKADGREIFAPAGQVDTFEVMADLISALENNDVDAINDMAHRLDSVRTQVSEFRAASAPKMYQLENTENFWSNYKPKLEQLLSKTEDTDLNEAAMRLNQLDLAYQSTIATAARIIQPSLINFLK